MTNSFDSSSDLILRGVRWKSAVCLGKHTDLNTFHLPGIYECDTPRNSQNDSVGWHLMVFAPSADQRPNGVLQVGWRKNTATMYARIHTGGQWTPWSGLGEGNGNASDASDVSFTPSAHYVFSEETKNVQLALEALGFAFERLNEYMNETVLAKLETLTDNTNNVKQTTSQEISQINSTIREALTDLDNKVSHVSKTASDNAVSLATLEARIAQLEEAQTVISITRYGAIKDVKSVEMAEKNNQALKKAIAEAAVNGGVVWVPAGTFYIKETVSIPSNVTLRGAGLGVTVLKLIDTGNKSLQVVSTTSGETNINITVEHLTVDGNRAEQTGTAEVTLVYVRGRAVRNVMFNHVEAIGGKNGVKRLGHGFRVDPVNTSHVMFNNCVARQNDQDGFTVDGGEDVTLNDCLSEKNGRYGVAFASGAKRGAINNVVSAFNQNNFMIFDDAGEITINGGASRASEQDGIRIRRGTNRADTRVSLSNVVVELSGRNGLAIAGASANFIDGCKFFNNGQSAPNVYADIIFCEDTVNSSSPSEFNTVSHCYFLSALDNKTATTIREVQTEASDNTFIGNVTRSVGKTV